MEITGMAISAISSITGFIAQGGSSAYIFLAFVAMIAALLVLSKIFNVVLAYVSVAIISAMSPFLINMLSSTFFGISIVSTSPSTILMFMVGGTAGMFIYKIVYLSIGIVENFAHMATRVFGMHEKKHHGKDTHKHHEHKEDEE